MRTEAEIRDRIQELEDLTKDPDIDDAEVDTGYLDEGQQSELMTLLWVLGEDDGW